MYTIAKSFPIEEKYNLTDQLIRSSRSITSNISEGHGRFHFKEQIRYCITSRGSLTETLNHLITVFDCSYITDKQLQDYREKYLHILKLINGYIAFLRKQKDNFVND
ncbi:MAG: four helix bundle protein [Chitinophagaceae bacterium]|nr:four helix bundle protein [Chitinophagaceae bacterium]MCW5905017.1 four helix bundle protein [Chitinophagaceae bacterium]